MSTVGLYLAIGFGGVGNVMPRAASFASGDDMVNLRGDVWRKCSGDRRRDKPRWAPLSLWGEGPGVRGGATVGMVCPVPDLAEHGHFWVAMSRSGSGVGQRAP